MRDVVNMRNDISSLLTLKDNVTTLSSQVFDIIVLGKPTTKRPSSEAESPVETCPDLEPTNGGKADIIPALVAKATVSDNNCNSRSERTIKLHRGQALDDLIAVFKDTSVDLRVFVKNHDDITRWPRRGFG